MYKKRRRKTIVSEKKGGGGEGEVKLKVSFLLAVRPDEVGQER